MAWDHRLCRAVLAVFIRAVFGLQRRRARRRGLRCGTGGAVTAIERAGAALNLNVHFHSLVADGVFVADQTGTARFVPLPPPANGEVARLVDTIRRRVVRLARRRGIELEQAEMAIHPSDALAEDSPLLAGICGASVAGRIATGEASIEQVGWEMFELMLAVASGRKTWAEHWGLKNDLVLFNPAPIT